MRCSAPDAEQLSVHDIELAHEATPHILDVPERPCPDLLRIVYGAGQTLH